MSRAALSLPACVALVVLVNQAAAFAQGLELVFHQQQPSASEEQRFVFAGDVSGINIRHEHGIFSCCLAFTAVVEREGNALRVTEQDGDLPCGCADVFGDVSIGLHGLEPGTYEVFLHAEGGGLLATAEVIVPETGSAVFIRGAVNDGEAVDMSDAIKLLDYLYLGDDSPPCLDAADVNDDGAVNITDPIYLLDFLFVGGPAPPEPFVSPGEDPTADAIACDLSNEVIAVDFVRDGDFNGDGARSLADGISFLSFLDLGRAPPACEDAADMNDDGVLDMDDFCGICPPCCPTFLILGPPPPVSTTCGPDATPDRLGCTGPGCEQAP